MGFVLSAVFKVFCTHPGLSALRKLLMAAGSSDFKMNKYDDMAVGEGKKMF